MLKTCLTEEACMFIHQQLMQQMLSHQFIYYSQPPVIIPHTTESVLEVGFEATAIHIWLDSIIKNNHNLSNTNALIFVLEKDTDYYQKYTIHLYGSNKYSLTNTSGIFAIIMIVENLQVETILLFNSIICVTCHYKYLK